MKTDAPFASKVWSDTGYAERPRYYPRQLITPDDLTLGIEYLLKLQRRHNRLLHGWGVVCGAQVAPVLPANGNGTARPWKVIVRPGYILDPYGHEVLIDHDVCFDLRTRCVTGVTGEACGEKVDPWCSDVYVRPEENRDAYVAVRYKQVLSRPVRVQPAGCGCDDDQCEFSRWRDAYEICVLEECPASHHGDPPSFDEIAAGAPLQDCPECPTDPWVVLARVRTGPDGEIEEIDNCSCRRMVVSLARYWWRCESLAELSVEEGEIRRGEEGVIVIRGARLSEAVRVGLPRGVEEIRREMSDGGDLKLTVRVAPEAEPGPRTIAIVMPDGALRRREIRIESGPREGAKETGRRRGTLRRPGGEK